MRGVFATAVVCLAPALAYAAEGTPPAPACAVEAPGGRWSDAAQWVAGLNNRAFSATLTDEQRAAWNDFSRLSAADWANLNKQYLTRIEAWRSHNLPAAPATLAFYPFGGPDAANLLAFYPDARDYVMIGLEPLGCLPSAITDYTPAYFAELRQSLSSVVAMGFFKTDDMRRDVTHSDLNGVLPLLLFLLSRAGFTINDVAPIGISPTGAVAPLASIAKPETTGIAIQFSDARHGARTLRYFSLNLEDSRLEAQARHHQVSEGSPRHRDAGEGRLVPDAQAVFFHHSLHDSRQEPCRGGGGFRHSVSLLRCGRMGGAAVRNLFPADPDVQGLEPGRSQGRLCGPGVQPLDFGLGYRHRGQSNLLVAVRKK